MAANLEEKKKYQKLAIICIEKFEKRFYTPLNSLSVMEFIFLVYIREKRLNKVGLHGSNLCDEHHEKRHGIKEIKGK